MVTLENIGKKCLWCCNDKYLSLLFCLFVLCTASVNTLQIVFSNSSYDSSAKLETRQIFKEEGFLLRV